MYASKNKNSLIMTQTDSLMRAGCISLTTGLKTNSGRCVTRGQCMSSFVKCVITTSKSKR